jgi:hypothetical protein
LRQQRVFLDDPPSVITASLYIAEKHDEAAADPINRYVSNLKQLLRCPPEIKPSITPYRCRLGRLLETRSMFLLKWITGLRSSTELL